MPINRSLLPFAFACTYLPGTRKDRQHWMGGVTDDLRSGPVEGAGAEEAEAEEAEEAGEAAAEARFLDRWRRRRRSVQRCRRRRRMRG